MQTTCDGYTGGRGERVPGERARLVHVANRREVPHQVRRAAEGADRKPAADDLPEHRQLGVDPEPLLRAAAGDPEAGDHLVEDEQRPRGVAQLAQGLEEPGRRRDDAHVPGDRLDDHAREALAVALEGTGGGDNIVVRRDDRVRGGAGRHARGRRDAERRGPGACLGEQRVGVPVVAAGELQDPVALRRSARKPDRAHPGLGAGADEPHLLDRRERVDDLGRELDLAFGRRAEGRPVAGRGANRLDRRRVRVPEEERPEGHHPVDEALAVDRLQVRALRAPHEERLVEPNRLHRADRRVDPARDQPLCLTRQVGQDLQCCQPASSLAQYVTTKSAPARLIAVSDSVAAWRSSIQPFAAAALTIAYSPETLYAATGRSKRSRTARSTSRFGSAGLTISASAPSATSSSHSRSASRTFAGSSWYPRRSPNDGADSAASRKGP